MAYDETIAQSIRTAVKDRPDVIEKKMFGGLAFLLDGKMFCGALGSEVVVRLPMDHYEQALRTPGLRPMDFTGRPMRGFVFVGAECSRHPAIVTEWVRLALEFVSSLPIRAKKAKPVRSGRLV